VDAARVASVPQAAHRVNEKLKSHPLFSAALDRRDTVSGSNEWGVTGSRAAGGRPVIANDPHLALNIPCTFYEWHLVVKSDPDRGPENVSGVGFPGAPGVILGQNDRITWGATTNPMDVSDVFSDKLYVLQPQCVGALACIESPPGTFHPVDIQLGVTYRFNVIGDAVNDNLATAARGPPPATPHPPGSLPKLRHHHRTRRSAPTPTALRHHGRARAPVHGLPRHPAAPDLLDLEPGAEPEPVPGRSREVRRGLAELGLRRRGREPRLLH